MTEENNFDDSSTDNKNDKILNSSKDDEKKWNFLDSKGRPYANVVFPTWEEKQRGVQTKVEFYDDKLN
ncbi:hypothetical protein [Companilactobacillus ginsenosidimutans]|uniref:Uncharacterized protein n=1 Tax=Companilactobacillus ginsenosidimutans TaxID=1007676 RepID=A0A0H4QK32_9LACO|nr:hypothetical protein [Companilactobacillus ginsenosidimutans]AKP67401.1 hypothetical protein ABM34_07540 [Companilactobacillus ginsenosidimutans]